MEALERYDLTPLEAQVTMDMPSINLAILGNLNWVFVLNVVSH